MLNAPVMEANDAVSGSMAECYVTIDGNRYNMMQLYSFESSAKINSQDVKILGRTGIGKKPTGWSGSWKGTAHFNQSVFRRWFLIYCKTGRMTPFEIQVSNEDPSSSAGRQTITHTGCLIDSSILAKFDAGDLAPPRRGGKKEGTPRFPFLFGLQPFRYCNSGGRNGCAVPPSTNSAPKGERVPV